MKDLISRQSAIALADKLKDDFPDDERIADAVIAHNEGILEYQTALSALPSAQPENIIRQFRDYQVEWLTSHCDLGLEPTLEEWVVRFLNDTAECLELE